MLKAYPDSPDYYSEEELKAMLKAFNNVPDDEITAPGIPFSYPEIQRALIRIQNMKDD